MAVICEKPWKPLIDRDMKKHELQRESIMNAVTIVNFNLNKNDITELLSIKCSGQDCNFRDIEEGSYIGTETEVNPGDE